MRITKLFTIAALGALAARAAFAAEGRVANVSMRARVGTGQEVVVMGLVVRSDARVLIRAIGPSLARFGVTDLLQDPMLVVFDATGNVVAEAQGLDTLNFVEHEEVVGLGARLGAFAIEGLTKDAVMVRTLPSGAYTIHIKSSSDGSGMALGEAYFDDQPAG